jgi:hypothetical protein
MNTKDILTSWIGSKLKLFEGHYIVGSGYDILFVTDKSPIEVKGIDIELNIVFTDTGDYPVDEITSIWFKFN